MRQYYLLLELLPVLAWCYGHYLNKRYSHYPDFSFGYPNRRIRRTRQAWDFGNRLMAKSIKTSASLMILLNLIFFFLNVVNFGFAIFLNCFIIVIGFISGELKLRQLIDDRGRVNQTTSLPKQKVSFKK